MKPVRDQYNALFRRYGVRMVFSGHVHNYEHLWVPADERPSRPADGAERPKRYPLGDGIHYIVTGGGGGPLGSITPRRELPSFGFRQAAERGYHVVTLEVDGKKITVRRVAISGGEKDFAGKVTDEFVIEPSK